MGRKKKVTIGYKYYLGIHFTLCHGELDSLSHIWVDDRLMWSGTSTGGQIFINQENCFGGEKREGGIMGLLDFIPGSTTQGQNAYLVSRLGSGVPAYRRVAAIVLNQMYIGTNYYLKKWGFRAKRIYKRSDGNAQWYTAKAAIGNDMNPAHIIYECLTDNDWGMGYLSSDLDETAFTLAADTLYNESFGMSILWDREATVEAFIKDVLRHIDAALYVDKATGKFTLKLMRADYSVGSLMTFDESNVVRVEEYACSTPAELVNTVILSYWDAATGNNASMTVQDIAMVQVQGGTVAQTVEYGGITNGSLASRVASRDLKALSTPLVRCTIYTTRAGSAVKPGDAVKLNWPDYGVSNLVMRVAMIDFGSATDNTIKVTLLQDVFSLGTATYAAPAPTEWVSLSNPPQPAANRILMEAPYYTLVREYGEYEINERLSTLPDFGVILAGAARPTGDSISAEVYIDAGGGYYNETGMDFCAYGVTTSIVQPMDTVVPLSAVSDFNSDMINAGDYAMIDNEIIEVVSYSQSSITIKRGCLDTVPAQHSAGSKIYGAGALNGLGQTDFVYGESVNVKILPRTGQGELAIASAPASSLTFNRRATRPYPPGAWAISGSYFPTIILDTPITATWAHRNRLQQTGTNIVDFTEGSITPETGTTYEIRLYNHTTSALLTTASGLTGTSYSSFPAMSGNFQLRMELWSVRDGHASLYKHSHVFTYENIYRLTTENAAGHILTEAGDTLTTE